MHDNKTAPFRRENGKIAIDKALMTVLGVEIDYQVTIDQYYQNQEYKIYVVARMTYPYASTADLDIERLCRLPSNKHASLSAEHNPQNKVCIGNN